MVDVRKFLDPDLMAEPIAVVMAKKEGFNKGYDRGYRNGVATGLAVMVGFIVLVKLGRMVLG
jgi:hypothetical protein